MDERGGRLAVRLLPSTAGRTAPEDQRIDPASKRVACGPYEQGGWAWSRSSGSTKAGIKYFAFNLVEEMDRPGEWYLDRREGHALFLSAIRPIQATMEIGMLSVPMVAVAGAAHVHFEGLVFDLSRANGMVMHDCEDCLIAGCTVQRFAGPESG